MPAARRRFVALVCVVAGACSASGDGSSDDDTTAPRGTDASVVECLDHSSTVRRQTPEGNDNVYLVDAAVSDPLGCVDIVTFEFRSDGRQLPPGYSVEYEDGPFRDFTSGDEFEPAGEAFLVLRFLRTSVFTMSPSPDVEPEPTYTGRESIDPSGMNHLQEARIVQGDEDGAIQWVIGLDSKRPFNIDASTVPLLPEPSDTTTTTSSPPGPTSSSTTTTSTTTTTTTPPTSTTFPTAATSKIVVRIG
jgi:cell division septation protein DedD